MEERKVEQGPRRTWNTGGGCRELTPAPPALALPLCSEAWGTEQQLGLQKSRQQEMRSHRATRARQTQQQLLLLRESAEGNSPAKISSENRGKSPLEPPLLERSTVDAQAGALWPEVLPLSRLLPSPSVASRGGARSAGSERGGSLCLYTQNVQSRAQI